MKAVLISIKPKYCELIARGEKTIEVRHTVPKIDTPFKCYIYCTKPRHIYEDIISAPTTKDTYLYAGGKVIGEFMCNYIEILFSGFCNPVNYMTDALPRILSETALSKIEFAEYVNSRQPDHDIYGWHISGLKIYDKPRELNEFVITCQRKFCSELCNHYKKDCKKGLRCIIRAPQSWCYMEQAT